MVHDGLEDNEFSKLEIERLNAEAGNTKAKLAEHDSNAQQQAVQIEKLETQSREAQEQIAEGDG